MQIMSVNMFFNTVLQKGTYEGTHKLHDFTMNASGQNEICTMLLVLIFLNVV